MSGITLNRRQRAVDLSSYAEDILIDDDRPLFSDAVAAAKGGALRAAYVMIWLSCAESIKRRFREAQRKDDAAGRIVGEIDRREQEQKSVDKFLLEKAREYGFLTDSEYEILSHVYEMRCCYAHPYEKAPSPEEVTHAAAAVVEHVLSKPLKLRHGFGERVLKSLLEKPRYLDDHQPAVAAFAKDMIVRLDENIYGWFLEKYWKELEELAGDPSMGLFFRRGIWFCQTVIREVGCQVFTHDEWHEKVGQFPKTLMQICEDPDIFKEIGVRAQDSLVGVIIDESKIHPHVLVYLERLSDCGELTKRQKARFRMRVLKMQPSELRAACLSTKTCFKKIIHAMKSYDWNIQNPVIDLVMSNGPEKAAILSNEQQVELGRNILQAAEGGSWSASRFLKRVADGGASWPFDVVRGMAMEMFTNEKNEIRFKVKHLESVLSAIDGLDEEKRTMLVAEIALSVDKGAPKKFVDRREFDTVIDRLAERQWTAPLINSLQEKAAALPEED